MHKKNVMVIFGGCSPEHEISKRSAMTVFANISEEKYNVIPVYITPEGKWLLYDGSIDNLRSVPWEKFGTNAVLSPDRVNRGLLRMVGEKVKTIPVDVIFPVLHGAYGEDGAIQGLFELSGIPYVGCGVLSSAICMDKSVTKMIAASVGLPITEYASFFSDEVERISKYVGRRSAGKKYPCFVKPASMGSSLGISKANNRRELEEAVLKAGMADNKILIEKAVDGRELECAVLEGPDDELMISGVGEILAAADFYDYNAKYNNRESRVVIPAVIPAEAADLIKKYSSVIFKAVCGRGFARVDFFLENGTGKVIFNEINTIPGFTSISMYPMLWEAEGIMPHELIDRLIETAGLNIGSGFLEPSGEAEQPAAAGEQAGEAAEAAETAPQPGK